MSRRRRKHQLHQVAAARRDEFTEAVSRLLVELESAESRAKEEALATKSSVTPDFRRVAEIMSQYPQLMRQIGTYTERELAREYALTVKRPPTGSHPQEAVTGVWAGGSTARNPLPNAVENANGLREFSELNEWVRAAINIRRTQIGRADIAVVPRNPLKPWNKDVQKRLERLLQQPNEYRDSYRSLIEPVIEDVLVLDRGCISKDMDSSRTPRHLYYEDGATIKIFPEWDGNVKAPRYLFENPASNVKVPLRNDECICIIANPATYRFGLSPVQVLKNTIKADLKATESASHLVEMKPPPHIIQIPGASDTQIVRLRDKYDAEIAGRKEIFWMGGDEGIQVKPLVFNARESQWLEWQEYLAKKIATVFQISPQQLGITFDINKATSQTQQQIYEDTGLIPLLLLIEEYLNRELLTDFASVDRDGREQLEKLNLRVLYPEVSEASRQMHAEKAVEMAAKGLPGLPSMTLNQILALRGEQPVDGGNTFYVPSGMGPKPWLSYDGVISEFIDTRYGDQDPMGGPLEDGMSEHPNKNQKAPAVDPNTGQPLQPGQQPGQTVPGAQAPMQGGGGHAGVSGAGVPRTTPQQVSPVDHQFLGGADRRGPGVMWRPGHLMTESSSPVTWAAENLDAIKDEVRFSIETGTATQLVSTWAAMLTDMSPSPTLYLPYPPTRVEVGERVSVTAELCSTTKPGPRSMMIVSGAPSLLSKRGYVVSGEFVVKHVTPYAIVIEYQQPLQLPVF